MNRLSEMARLQGIPLFATVPRDVRLRHVATCTFRSGLAQSEYHVDTGAGSRALKPLW